MLLLSYSLLSVKKKVKKKSVTAFPSLIIWIRWEADYLIINWTEIGPRCLQHRPPSIDKPNPIIVLIRQMMTIERMQLHSLSSFFINIELCVNQIVGFVVFLLNMFCQNPEFIQTCSARAAFLFVVQPIYNYTAVCNPN